MMIEVDGYNCMLCESTSWARVNPIGKKYGMLTVLSRIGSVIKNNRQIAAYVVQCDCGTKMNVSWDKLSKKARLHCGCQPELRGKHKRVRNEV